MHRESLVLPIRDTAGATHSLQIIGADGGKRYLTGGRIRGCYFGVGKPDEVLCIAEGFATGASIHEAKGYAVAVAFDAGNLQPAAKALREKFPDLRLILCADDDCRTEGNPGITKAKEAAQAVGRLLALPDFGPDRPEGATDFNDLHQMQGLEAVARCIDAALNGPASAREAMTKGTNQEYQKNLESFFRMAMKAQNQCRMTLETLANIKNPPVIYAKQANIAHGPQQVNNGTSAPAHAEKIINQSNELLEVQHGQRLDTGTAGAATSLDPAMATVGEINGAANR